MLDKQTDYTSVAKERLKQIRRQAKNWAQDDGACDVRSLHSRLPKWGSPNGQTATMTQRFFGPRPQEAASRTVDKYSRRPETTTALGSEKSTKQ